MKVLKFGGSSLATAENIAKVSKIIESSNSDSNHTTYVICSAIGDMTDFLITMSEMAANGDESYLEKLNVFIERHQQIAKQLIQEELLNKVLTDLEENHKTLGKLLEGIFLIREVSLRTSDYLLSFGERNSCYILAKFLEFNNQNASYLDARKVICTDSNFGFAKVDFNQTNRKIQEYDKKTNARFVIVTGFIASDGQGVSTTLGRGGSDYSAAIYSAALDADVLEIWTDVTGLMTTDPRKVKSAYTIPQLSYDEAMELSHFGASVIYPPTILPACAKNIPIFIKNTFDPTAIGTEIGSNNDTRGKVIKGLSAVTNIVLITIEGSGLHGTPGTASRLFSVLAQAKVNIMMISQASSEHSICFVIKNEDEEQALLAINEEFEREITLGVINKPKVESDLCILAIVGLGMRNMRGVAGKLFGVLGKNGVNIKAIAQGSSELNISFIVESKDQIKALNVIHESFFLTDIPQLNLFIVGVGLIGETLIEQIRSNHDRLLKNKQLDIRISGIARSNKMILDKDGIDLEEWKTSLSNSESGNTIEKFVSETISLNRRNAIFVDCTASDIVPGYYEELLNASISISTPNKVASSSSFKNYSKLKALAKQKNIHLKYETNVGAGLPVVSTIHNLIDSGDEIISIQGVLSGSCSFIFNSFDGKESFHDVVKKARDLGFTEPDPRDDLSGKDIQRKITILIREAGFEIETENVEIAPILPEYCAEQLTVDSFMSSLIEKGDYFKTLVDEASIKNEKLRFIASYHNGKAKVSLESVGEEHPFYNLQGSDNMIVIHSKRYDTRPLVVSGPGAGAEVTAAGVFAEIINMI